MHAKRFGCVAPAYHGAERSRMAATISADNMATTRESFGTYERAQERAVAYTVLARRRTLAGYADRTPRPSSIHAKVPVIPFPDHVCNC